MIMPSPKAAMRGQERPLLHLRFQRDELVLALVLRPPGIIVHLLAECSEPCSTLGLHGVDTVPAEPDQRRVQLLQIGLELLEGRFELPRRFSFLSEFSVRASPDQYPPIAPQAGPEPPCDRRLQSENPRACARFQAPGP
jgi:hypothetical protein